MPFFAIITPIVIITLFSYYYSFPIYYKMLNEQNKVDIIKNTIRVDYEKTRILKIISSFHSGLPHAEAIKISNLIFNIGKEYEINPALILAVIRVESSFNNYSYSDVGAVGLMQVRPVTGLYLIKKYNIKSKKFNYNTKYIEYLPASYLYNPSLNIRIGARYLLSLLYEFKSLKLALFAYNVGPTIIFKTINSNRFNLKEESTILNKLESDRSKFSEVHRLFSSFYSGYYKRVEKYFKIYNKNIFKNNEDAKPSFKNKLLPYKNGNIGNYYFEGVNNLKVLRNKAGGDAFVNYNPAIVVK